MKRILTCLIVLLISSMAFSQRGNNWALYKHWGITFNTSPPSFINTSLQSDSGFHSLANGALPTSMSDCNGNLLFYGSVNRIWNKYHQLMKNSHITPMINHHGGSSCLAVPVPDSLNQYYYITSYAYGVGHQTTYSIIDMNLANDSGAVVDTKKNILIKENHLAGSMVTVPHANGRDIWLITYNHSLQAIRDSINAFLITPTGISQPISSYVSGNYKPIGAYFTSIKPSHDGENIVITGIPSNSEGIVAYYFDFNNSSGLLSNQQSITIQTNSTIPVSALGVEFSPDDKNIFISTYVLSPLSNKLTNYIYEYKREELSQKKAVAVYTPPNSWGCQQYFVSSLQMGPDNKIYGLMDIRNCLVSDTQMMVINSPNGWGGNQINIKYVNISSSNGSYNGFPKLPYFYYTHYYVDIDLGGDIKNGLCVEDSAQQIILKDAPGKYVNYTLYFGDGDSIIVNTPFTNGADTFYHYYPEGDYTIKVETVNIECSYTKAFEEDITIKFKPGIQYAVDKDSAACWEHHFGFTDSSLLTTSTKLLWGNGKVSNGVPNGSMAEYYATEDTFTYQYIAFNAQCSDTVQGQLISKFLPKPNVRLGVTDTAFCQDESFILTDSNTDVTGRLVNWGDGLSDNMLAHTYLDTGTFEVFVTDTAMNGCFAKDSILLSATDIRLISAGALEFNQACEDASMEYAYTFFNADSVIIDWGDGNYFYSDKFSDLVNHTYTTGSYNMQILVFNSECLDTIFSKPVELLPDPVADASVADNKLCEGDDIVLSNSSTGASSYKVLWGDMDEEFYDITASEFTHTYTADGNLTASVIAINAQNCPDTAKLPIIVLPLPIASFTMDADSGCRPLDLGVTNGSSDYTTHFINWGDGSGEIPNGSFSHVYTDKGSYDITLGISNGYCADTAYGSVKVTGLSGVETSSVVVATVDGVTAIYIEWQPVAGANGYNLYRSANGVDYSLIAEKTKTTNYFDVINTTANSWYYKVLGVDSCDNLSLESNLGRTIFLKGEVIGKNQAAMLNWNPYEAWENGVLVYQLEVQDAFGGFNTLASKQTLTQEDTGFLDLTRDEKCYRIVAYEQGGNNAVSTSNTVCLPYQPLLWAPNAFSPNGDGYNDTWGVMHVAMEKFSFSIYNRWGEKLFESKYPTDTWDGDGATIGVYLYIINGKGINGKPFLQKGEIHLVK